MPGPEAIVRALAEKAPVWQEEFFGDDHECTLCGVDPLSSGAPPRNHDGKPQPRSTWLQDPDHHLPDCPWRMAREWVSQQKAPDARGSGLNGGE